MRCLHLLSQLLPKADIDHFFAILHFCDVRIHLFTNVSYQKDSFGLIFLSPVNYFNYYYSLMHACRLLILLYKFSLWLQDYNKLSCVLSEMFWHSNVA